MKISVGKQADAIGQWYLIDADGLILGRLATRVARILMGKHRPTYTPHVDSGDHVVVVNAGSIRVTGDKFEKKNYYRHTSRPGSLRTRTYRQTVERFPTRPLQLAVKRMLPKNRLQARRIRRLHIYVGPNHRHQVQQPSPVKLS